MSDHNVAYAAHLQVYYSRQTSDNHTTSVISCDSYFCPSKYSKWFCSSIAGGRPSTSDRSVQCRLCSQNERCESGSNEDDDEHDGPLLVIISHFIPPQNLDGALLVHVEGVDHEERGNGGNDNAGILYK